MAQISRLLRQKENKQMAKIKVSADAILAILQGIMNDAEINYIIKDPSAPDEWKGKNVQEILNVEYYTFRHRPMDTELIVRELIEKGQDVNVLHALTRSFCILSLTSTERVYSKDNDIVTVSANLEYWLQADKVKLLEDMVEDISIATNGERISVQIGEEERQVLVAPGTLGIGELQEATEFGEMVVCDWSVDFVFYPNVVSRSDYFLEFLISGDGSEEVWKKLPFSSISIANNMTQKSVPMKQNVRNVANINLSRIKTFTLSFDGYKNPFIDMLTNQSLSNNGDNNKAIIMKLSRKEESFRYDCVVKDHIITVQEDTGNEMHSLTLTIKGVQNGTPQS